MACQLQKRDILCYEEMPGMTPSPLAVGSVALFLSLKISGSEVVQLRQLLSGAEATWRELR